MTMGQGTDSAVGSELVRQSSRGRGVVEEAVRERALEDRVPPSLADDLGAQECGQAVADFA